MKHIYLAGLMLFLPFAVFAQSMNVHTSGGTTSYTISGIDSITFSTTTTAKILISKGSTSGSDNDLYTMNTDGTGISLLYNNAGDVRQARWNSDKSKIVFSTNTSSTGAYEVFIMNGDGTGATQITTDNPDYGNVNPYFRSATKIWYANAQSAGWTEITEINYDGTGKTQLTNANSTSQSIGEFVINAAASKIYYYKQTSSWGPDAEIYSANIDFTGETNLTNSTDVSDGDPALSPAENKIAYRKEMNYLTGDMNIFTMNTDGSSKTQLTTVTGSQYATNPVWSTDGTKIYYRLYDGTQSDIWSMNADGTGKQNLTNTASYNEFVWQVK